MDVTSGRQATLFAAYLMAQSGFLFGCWGGSNLPGETGTVSGRVIYRGAPIPEESTVVFVHRENGIIGTGRTNANGEFTMMMRGGSEILVGEYSVGVTPPGEPDPELNIFTHPPEAWKKIPQRYWSHETSDESFTVTTGANVYMLDMED